MLRSWPSWASATCACTAAVAAMIRISSSWPGASAKILPDRVTILAASATKPEALDRGDAERELEDGKKMWSEAGEDPVKYEEANEVIYEAEARLSAIQGGRY